MLSRMCRWFCLIKKMHNPTALLILTIADFLVVMLWAFAFKKIYASLFPKKKLLLVHADKLMFHLMGRIESREDKYEIKETVRLQDNVEEIIRKAENYDGVIIGDIPAGDRNELMKRCYANNIRSYTVPKVSDILLRTSVELNIFDSPLYLSRNIDGLPWDQAFLKRMEDILVSGIMLIFTSPFFLIMR